MQQIAPSPYQIGYGPKPTTDISDFERQYENLKNETEATSKAPKHLPNDLGTIVSQLSEIFVKLLDIRSRLEVAKQNVKKDKEIDKMKLSIDDINAKIFDLSSSLTDIAV